MLFLRPSKIKAKNSFTLIGLGTWIGQGDGVGTGTSNGFSLGSKPSGTIIIF